MESFTPIELESVTPEAVTKLLDVVCEHYDYVVVDLPPAWTRWTIDVIGGSDVVLLVMQLSVAAVQQALEHQSDDATDKDARRPRDD